MDDEIFSVDEVDGDILLPLMSAICQGDRSHRKLANDNQNEKIANWLTEADFCPLFNDRNPRYREVTYTVLNL